MTDRISCAPPRATPEARDHLVEDEHGSMGRGERAGELEEARRRRNDTTVAWIRLHDQRRDARAVLGEELLQTVGIVPLENRDVGERRFRLTLAFGPPLACATSP